ncbi:type II CRISPR RNA-guided endonuclease Cas9 [Oryzicola mucosus]|uniref:CRISPR-associated endonuclease Cas9 n=1 Tax=Oryzicola mucosus TaxID=2767425 RepID=A0A8J6U109_9HYPH|nr:type II CRISPR RNA-guided endonuclease Cas9 [Oryzicola mucosus]MBD0413593.1 type II CRISPR RNA-guided endonuclease Cas9 [Oryzicola mucosus]
MLTLGIDIGSTSLGWCLIETQGEPLENDFGKIVAIGIRIFSDGREPQTKASLAVQRRAARAMRRRRDRYVARRGALLKALTDYGLMPANEDARKKLLKETGDGEGGDLSGSIYGLRSRALGEKLHPYQIGRVLFALDQRRGFKSNRKTDKGDNEAGKIAIGVSRLQQKMAEAGAKSYGDFLYKRRLDGKSVRTRLRPESGEDAKGDGYDFYPSRQALEDEFDDVCAEQAGHHPELLTQERIKHLRDITFYQRPLKPPVVGKCSYNPAEERLAKAHPLFQEFRLYKELNELELIDEQQKRRKLTLDERDKLYSQLRGAKTGTFISLRKTLGLGKEIRFNKESETRDKLLGDEVYSALSDKKGFGNRWSTFGLERQWQIVQKLRNTEDEFELHAWLTAECGLNDDQTEAVAKVHLPEGYGRIGETAAKMLVDALKTETDAEGKVIPESEAAKRCGYNHSDKSDLNFPGHKELPHYQEVLDRHIPPGTGNPDDVYDVFKGRITNPSVHIALNQLRRTVNALIKRHGKPDRIAIELGRELKLSDKQKDEIDRTIRKNTREAEARSEELKALGRADTGYNRLRLKLWQELNKDQPLNRVCIYSGEPITAAMVFSPEVDIDHILPYSKTLDDSEGNKILCKTHANRQKRNRAPAGVSGWADRYEDILARASTLPRNKRWRFAADAMEKFADQEGFLARQLTDTQYMSRLSLTYLASLYPTEEAGADGVLRRHSRIRALPGRMTEMLRRKWDLNDLLPDRNIGGSDTVKEKNRKDHRHHAVDAFVIACTSRSLIQRIATASAKLEAEGAERVIEKIADPWPGFREQLREALRNTVVSHRPDHGTVSREAYASGRGQTAGKLHNDTAYSPTGEVDEKGSPRVVRRRQLSDFKSEKDLAAIRDTQLREALWAATRGLSGKEFEAALIAFSRAETLDGRKNPFRNLRHIRVLETETIIPIKDKDGKVYKGYLGGGNYRFDVWQLPDGRWDADVISMFEAHQPGYVSKIRQDHHNPKKVMSLQIGDMVAYEHPESGERVIARVRKFDQRNKQIYLDPHNEGGRLDDRHKDEADPFRSFSKRPNALKAIKARQVRVDEIGRVWDPGPRV